MTEQKSDNFDITTQPMPPTIDFTLVSDIRTFRKELDAVKNTLDLLKDVTEINKNREATYALHNVIRSIIVAKLWSGRLLKGWGEASPYVAGNDVSTFKVELPTDTSKSDLVMEGKPAVTQVKMLRSYLGGFQERLEYTFDMPLEFVVRQPLQIVFQYISEARMFLGLLLQQVGEKIETPETIAEQAVTTEPKTKPVAIDDVLVNKLVLQFHEGKIGQVDVFNGVTDVVRDALVKAGHIAADTNMLEQLTNAYIASREDLLDVLRLNTEKVPLNPVIGTPAAETPKPSKSKKGSVDKPAAVAQ